MDPTQEIEENIESRSITENTEIHDTRYYQKKLENDELTLVSQKKISRPSSGCWKYCQRIVLQPKKEELPEIYGCVKDYAVCCPYNQLIKYGSSTKTLNDHLRALKCKCDLSETSIPRLEKEKKNFFKVSSESSRITFKKKINKK